MAQVHRLTRSLSEMAAYEAQVQQDDMKNGRVPVPAARSNPVEEEEDDDDDDHGVVTFVADGGRDGKRGQRRRQKPTKTAEQQSSTLPPFRFQGKGGWRGAGGDALPVPAGGGARKPRPPAQQAPGERRGRAARR